MTALAGRSSRNPLPWLVLSALALTATVGILLQSVSISLRTPHPDRIPIDYTFNDHCKKHLTGADKADLNAWEIYKMLKQGQCATVSRYCRVHERRGPEMLWLCEDPVTGIIGGLFVVLEAGEIYSGYGFSDASCMRKYGLDNFEYWTNLVFNKKRRWGPCP